MTLKKISVFPKNKWLKGLIIFLVGWILIHSVYITIDGVVENANNADVAIVLGNRVYGDGSLASWTQGRVDKALKLYQSKKVKLIFVSGGYSRESNYPEGTAMKAYLVKNGVPDSAVVVDNEGDNTYRTAVNFMNWNKEQKLKTVVIVSNSYHITRTKYIVRKVGFDGVIQKASSEVHDWKDITGTLREVVAFYKYLVVY